MTGYEFRMWLQGFMDAHKGEPPQSAWGEVYDKAMSIPRDEPLPKASSDTAGSGSVG